LDNDRLHHAKQQDEAEDDHGRNDTKQNDDDQHYGIKDPSAISGEPQCEYIRNAGPRRSERLCFGRVPESRNVESATGSCPSM